MKRVISPSLIEAAGLQENDIITHVNGTAITGSSELVSIVRDAQVGDTMTLTVYRMGQTMELTLTVGETIQGATAEDENTQQSQQSGNFFPWGYLP